MPDNLLNLLFALFILSLLSERVAEWLKFQAWFKWLFGIKNTTLKVPSAIEEQKRYYRILKINIAVSVVLSIIVRADLFYLLHHNGTMELGWPEKLTDIYPSSGAGRIARIVLGCICTGFFLSFGSKLWHDLLDIVLAFKEAKRQIALGFPVANPANFDALSNAEKEAAIKGAIETFGPKWKNTIEGFTGVGMGKRTIDSANTQTNDLVLEFYVNKKTPGVADVSNPVPAFINYGGINIPTDVKVKRTGIQPQWNNPGGDQFPPHAGESLSRINQKVTGTISLKVKKTASDGSTGMYMLSCYHIMFARELQSGILEVKPQSVLKSARDLVSPGTLTSLPGNTLALAGYGCINEFIDAAVAPLDDMDSLSDDIDELGAPAGLHSVTAEDIHALRVNFCGAKSGKRAGIIVKACNQTRPYHISRHFPGLFLKDLIELPRCSEEGDSGAPVMDNNRNIIGIIIGADETSTYVVPIQHIINNLKVFPLLKPKNN